MKTTPSAPRSANPLASDLPVLLDWTTRTSAEVLGLQVRFRHRGDKLLAKHIASELIERNFPISYAFADSHYAEHHGPTMLTHAFLNALLFLDFDRRGFEYPVVPIVAGLRHGDVTFGLHMIRVNCYGRAVVPSRGGTGHLNPATRNEPYGNEFGPAGPTAASCYQLRRLVNEILLEQPGKYVIMASSGWSHAFLTVLLRLRGVSAGIAVAWLSTATCSRWD